MNREREREIKEMLFLIWEWRGNEEQQKEEKRREEENEKEEKKGGNRGLCVRNR